MYIVVQIVVLLYWARFFLLPGLARLNPGLYQAVLF